MEALAGERVGPEVDLFGEVSHSRLYVLLLVEKNYSIINYTGLCQEYNLSKGAGFLRLEEL